MNGLQLLNLQHNQITMIQHLSHLQQLVFLNLCDNHISEMTGIEALSSLRILMLGKNRLVVVSGFTRKQTQEYVRFVCLPAVYELPFIENPFIVVLVIYVSKCQQEEEKSQIMQMTSRSDRWTQMAICLIFCKTQHFICFPGHMGSWRVKNTTELAFHWHFSSDYSLSSSDVIWSKSI